MSTLADRVDALLPQTQCRQCGYAGCRPYAEAIAEGRAGINRCPPGGEELVRELAEATGRPVEPLDASCGAPAPAAVAVIDEQACIGCTLCIQACPVDAIVGAAKLMHTVIAAECTGCRLCLPPCPVDCIAMLERQERLGREERKLRAAHFKRRYEARRARLERERAARRATEQEALAARRKREILERVIARARERLRERSD
ncbi:MAG TPA: RnfABCDGE type electron transport complex subunit B [Burkholderiales bacterium]|nr:RnfABCDGE type electron transport complex subunit B [Burkholderiales bacterium]